MLTADRLRELLHYDPDTGLFTWRIRRRGNARAGDIAGCIGKGYNFGYRLISVDNIRYLASRLAFLYMQGEWPPDQIDHINGNRADDRWCNLRPATNRQNKANSPGHDGSPGFKNVYRDRLSWMVSIGYPPRRVRKSFKCLGQAIKFRNKALREMYGSYARVDTAPSNRIKWTIRP